MKEKFGVTFAGNVCNRRSVVYGLRSSGAMIWLKVSKGHCRSDVKQATILVEDFLSDNRVTVSKICGGCSEGEETTGLKSKFALTQ